MDKSNNFSKYLSYLLRHHPESIHLKMDNQGWVLVDELIKKINKANVYHIDLDTLKEVVKNDNKKRYALKESEQGLLIRANQGHSLKDIKIQYSPIKPPAILYHGTGEKYIESILAEGIKPKSRQYVHLSSNINTAVEVGKRHGIAKVLEINTKQMNEDGIEFYLAENNVWLTSFIDKKYIKLITL